MSVSRSRDPVAQIHATRMAANVLSGLLFERCGAQQERSAKVFPHMIGYAVVAGGAMLRALWLRKQPPRMYAPVGVSVACAVVSKLHLDREEEEYDTVMRRDLPMWHRARVLDNCAEDLYEKILEAEANGEDLHKEYQPRVDALSQELEAIMAATHYWNKAE